MTIPRFTIDRSIAGHEGEGIMILSGRIDDELIRVNVANEIWAMVLDHFAIGGEGQPQRLIPEAYDAIERIGALIIERRGPPHYGVLAITLG